MGAGSNLLIRDNGIDGVTVITSKLNKISIDKDGVITANSGSIDAEVARFARDHCRSGLEFLIGIPGKFAFSVDFAIFLGFFDVFLRFF